MSKNKRIHSIQQLWEKIASVIVHFVEKIFYSLGVTVARHPWKTIIITWLFLLLSSAGLLKFHIEKNPMKLWIPPDSDYYYDTNWYIDKFGTGYRLQKIIVTAENILEPKILLAINNITNEVNSIQVDYNNQNFLIEDLCFKVPVVNFFNSIQNQPSTEIVSANTTVKGINKSDHDYSDPTLWIDDEFYCSFIENFPLTCLQYNILDLWKNDQELIYNLTKYDIIRTVNEVKTNPVTGHPIDYTELLGGIKYDNSGKIISANSLILIWYTQVNMSDVDLDEVGNLVGTEDWVTIPLAIWEKNFLDLMEQLSHTFVEVQLYYEAGRSFGDISGEVMFQELDKLFIGIILMFLYIQFALSRCNWLEIKLTLGSVGLLSVGMAYISAVSWCSMAGISFGPVHSSLPFLLMGLGIDDMFVIKACWENLTAVESKMSLPVKVGLTLQHAGVSIVITSFTDIVALLIGAITILPSLKSFCIYAAVGVFFIFCYSVTFYVAVFTLDIKRMNANRNGVFLCYKHKKQIHLSTQQTIFRKILSKFYKNVVFSIPAKIIVIIFTIVVTCFSIDAIFRLEQRFDPKWFIPDGIYYKNFLNAYEFYYPNEGNMAMVFLGEMNYNAEFHKLYDMSRDLENEPYIKDLVSWVQHFHGYVLKNYNIDLINSSISDYDFNIYLSTFLFSPVGGRFQVNFKFLEPFHCRSPATNITASTMVFKFKRFEGPQQFLPAMNRVKYLVKSTNTSTGDNYLSVWSKVFANWVTDEIIAVEVERNIELALVCVMVCTIILITNLQMCFWIFICVLLTIVNVLGFMQRWGMTVDIVCCIGLELAIGLCVDYAAHVGHTFLTLSEGTRLERAYKTVTSIGTAVLLGGGSTLISLSLLSMSKAYTFQSFFKIFLLVIVFGLFYGLIFLPVILSLIGPRAYKKKSSVNHAPNEIVELNVKEIILKGNIDLS